MSKHINYQTIIQNGIPAFVVIPYDEFLKFYPNAADDVTIPHEVVRIMIKQDVSRLKAWREYLGLTQQEVADKLGVSQAALSQIEAFDSKPRQQTLQKLADIYGVTKAHLK